MKSERHSLDTKVLGLDALMAGLTTFGFTATAQMIGGPNAKIEGQNAMIWGQNAKIEAAMTSKGLFRSNTCVETGRFSYKGRWTAVAALQFYRLLCEADLQ